MKRIILCADDYGQNTAISQAIIELLEGNYLSATSCMTNSPYWLAHAGWLVSFKDKVDIGLHFNLTEGQMLSSELQVMSLPQLMLKSHLRQLNQKLIEEELHLQLDQFIKGIGREPDFIDGHQHVHQFPVVRDALLTVYQDRLQKTDCYIRSIYDPHFFNSFKGNVVKHGVLQLSGARALKKALALHHIPHNTSFSGVYDFSKAENYKALFPRFLKTIQDGGLIMCHPGLPLASVNLQDKDPIASARVHEYRYFLSQDFKQDCANNQIKIARFKR